MGVDQLQLELDAERQRGRLLKGSSGRRGSTAWRRRARRLQVAGRRVLIAACPPRCRRPRASRAWNSRRRAWMATVASTAPSTSISRMAGSAICVIIAPSSGEAVTKLRRDQQRDRRQRRHRAADPEGLLPARAAARVGDRHAGDLGDARARRSRASTTLATGRLQSACAATIETSTNISMVSSEAAVPSWRGQAQGLGLSCLEQHAADQRRQRRRAAEVRGQRGAGGDDREQQDGGVLAGRAHHAQRRAQRQRHHRADHERQAQHHRHRVELLQQACAARARSARPARSRASAHRRC